MPSAGDNQDSSQDTVDTVDYVRQAEEMLAANKRKKDTKRKAVEIEYKQRVNKALSDFQDFHAAHQAKVSEAQATQFRLLNHVLHKRQNAEIEIWKHLMDIERSKRALAFLMVEMCNVRLEAMAEISTTGNVLDKALKT